MASCLDDENEKPLKVITYFSASRFALPSIPLRVLHSLVMSAFWSMVSTVSPFFPYVHADAVLDDLFHLCSSGGASFTEVITSSISAGTGSS